MKAKFALLLFCGATAILGCDRFNLSQNNSPNALFSKQTGEATPDEINGYWEGRVSFDSGADRSQIWRLKIQDERVSLAVQCFDEGRRSLTGATFRASIQDQGKRYRVVFEESRDFRVQSDDFVCGLLVTKDFGTFLYVDDFRLEVRPMFPDIEFEKLADLESDTNDDED